MGDEGWCDEGSPRDPDVDYDLWLIRQEELADRPPAVWWDDHLSDMRPKKAEQAEAALRRITSRGRGRGEVLQALRFIGALKREPPMTRRVMLAHAKEIERLIKAARKTPIYLLLYPGARLHHAIETIRDDAPKFLEELKAGGDVLRRDGEGLTNRAILELLKEVARAAGGPRYDDVTVLLGAVRVETSVGALKQLALRAGGGLSQPRAKLPRKPRGPRGRPRNPNAVRRRREVPMGTAADLEAAVRSRRSRGRDLDDE